MEISFHQTFGPSSANLQPALCHYPNHFRHNNATAAASLTPAMTALPPEKDGNGSGFHFGALTMSLALGTGVVGQRNSKLSK